MSYLLEGVRAGLVLALLVGPLVVLLLQLSIRRGTVAALAAAFGIWLSDLSFILLTHYGIGSLANFSTDGSLALWVGSIGGVLLVGTAVYMWFRDPPDLTAERDIVNHSGVLAGLLQGFALNTFNPFTIAFWSFFTFSQVQERDLSGGEAWAIYAGILLTIVVTDTAKVFAARKLRDWLRPSVLLKAQRFGALVLGVFGLVLWVRIWW